MLRFAAVLLLLIVVALIGLARPLSPRGLESHPRPARDYDDALRRVDALRALDSDAIASVCRTMLYTHGARTARAIVIFHGLTNCPAQFDSLARIAYARGANVLVPRLPRHGEADRMTDALAGSDAREWCTFADLAVDAARGLGDSVTVVGLSVGGTLAAWAAQERPDVDRAVLIAPMLGVAAAPGPWAPVVARLTGGLPNVFVWWDDKEKENLGGPKHVYPRFASRAVAATLFIGGRVMHEAPRHAPGVRSAAFIVVGGDKAVDNGKIVALANAWGSRLGGTLTMDLFPEELHLNHDIVDIEQVGGNPALTYPVLSARIGP